MSASEEYQLLHELLAWWHAYRLPILVSVLSIFAIARLAVQKRQARPKVSASPVPGSPTTSEKKSPLEDATVVEEKPRRGKSDYTEVIASAKVPLIRPTGQGPKRVTGTKVVKPAAAKRTDSFDHTTDRVRPLIFFSSLGGTTEAAAKRVQADMLAWSASAETPGNLADPQLYDLSEIEYDDFFISAPRTEAGVKYFYMVLVPTYNIDTVLDAFIEHLQESHNDFRIDTAPLSGVLGYSVFGFGDREGWSTEEEGFCSQAKDIDKWLAKLTGRKRAYPLGMGDVKSDSKERLQEWKLGVQEAIVEVASGRGLGEGVPGSGDPVESDEEDVDEVEDEETEAVVTSKRKPAKAANVDDLEDLGRMINKTDEDTAEKGPIAIDFTTYKAPAVKKAAVTAPPKEMVPKTSPTYAALTKQGYSIIGSHSGVKICRWTKSALRGRGSCYKYSFYGIQSHLCMETTPSLSCSNKCVFCWRHGTNPVGTNWRWVTDPPEVIFNGVTEAHYRKIKMMKGVPGVRADRFAEAMRIRHCALSLVGEPIFYPHINEFVGLLHEQNISTFLVCNAQHPAQLAALRPVTQLYVSIDASNKETLRKIDRPLHRDFWERFQACLDILRARRFEQRTVFRLTLVKGFNVEEEIRGYADLVERALPCFVEIKGVTYCGTSASTAAGLTMQNVPFYAEVQAFVLALDAELARRGLGYGIAAEHAHSCCVLLASDRFRRAGRWCTRIDYDQFFACVRAGRPFRPEDYVGEPTPDWALWGNGGFDPRDQRVYRKGKGKVKAQGEAEAETATVVEDTEPAAEATAPAAVVEVAA